MEDNSFMAKIGRFLNKYVVQPLTYVAEKVITGLNPDNLVPFLTKHLLYMLWILFVPIVLYLMAQGRELFTGLFDDTHFFTGWRASFLLVAYFLQAMAIILLPRPLFRDISFEDWKKVRYKEALDNPSLTYLLSALPVIMYGLVMIVVQHDRIPSYGWFMIVPTLILTVALAAVFEKNWTWSIRKTLWLLLCIIVACGMIVSWVPKKDPFWNYFITGTCLMAQIVIIGGLSKRLAEAFERSTKSEDLPFRKKWSAYDRLYVWAMGPLFLLIIGYMFCSNLEGPSPIFMLLVLTTCYLAVSRIYISWYIFRIKKPEIKWYKNWKRVLFWALSLSAFYVVFFVKSGIHDIRTVEAKTMKPEDRVTLDQWFEAWWAQNHFDTCSTEVPVYLIGVQGGGSRAGLWASEMLNRMEVASQYNFHRHCFAITSASGGSVGTGATLALWRFAAENEALIRDQLKAPRTRDNLYLDYANGFFQRNYLSGSFFDIFICEIGSRFVFWDDERSNRNYRLQKDEALGFARGLERGFFDEPEKSSLRFYQRLRLLDEGDAEQLPVDGFSAPNYPFKEYLSYWYDEKGKPKANLPLYLPISTNIQTGKASFSSPVKLDDKCFVDAIDVLEAVNKAAPGRTLNMVGATNLSELFPVMSAFTHIKGTGNFIDGGTYENMGLHVLQQLYFWLDQKRKTDPRCAKLRIKVIFIVNNQVETANAPSRAPVSQVVSPLKHASSTTIDGRTTYFTKRIQADIAPQDNLYNLWLQAPEPDSMRLRIPLGRWLSRRSVRNAEQRANFWDNTIDTIVQPIRQ